MAVVEGTSKDCQQSPPPLMKQTNERGSVAEPKVIQKLSFVLVGRYDYFLTEWTSLKDFIYQDSQTARFLIICEKIRKN